MDKIFSLSIFLKESPFLKSRSKKIIKFYYFLKEFFIEKRLEKI